MRLSAYPGTGHGADVDAGLTGGGACGSGTEGELARTSRQGSSTRALMCEASSAPVPPSKLPLPSVRTNGTRAPRDQYQTRPPLNETVPVRVSTVYFPLEPRLV